MPKRIGILLSGCGCLDGSKIPDTVLSLRAFDRRGAEPICLTTGINQTQALTLLTGTTEPLEERNAFAEASRIAGSKVSPLALLPVLDAEGLSLKSDGPPSRAERFHLRTWLSLRTSFSIFIGATP